MKAKGQAALEYLMTYGWALIVIAIVVGVLVYIMSTTTGGANCASDNTQIIYVDHAVASTGVTISLQNGSGKTITVEEDPAVTFDAGGSYAGTAPVTTTQVTPGATFSLTTGAVTETGTYRLNAGFKYSRGTGITHDVNITCTGSVGG